MPQAAPSLSQSTDLALLSSDAYNQGAYGQGSVPPGYVRLDVPQPAGSEGTGFHATAYRNVVTGAVVVAYAGTNDMNDLKGSDLQIFFHEHPEQKTQAIDFAERVAERLNIPVNSITYTGHSLGGGLAQLVAEANGAPAMTFNAPGMTFASSDPANAANQTNITNVNLQLDVVSTPFTPTSGTIGNTVTLPASTGQGLLMVGAMLLAAANPAAGLAAIGALGLSQHGIDVVLEQLGQTHATDHINGWQRDGSGNWFQRDDPHSAPSYASPEQQTRLNQTRDSLVDLNNLAATSQDRIGQMQAYNGAITQIQNDFFAEKLTLQNTPEGPILVDQDGTKVASIAIHDDGSILISAGNKDYSVASDGKNSDGTVGANVVYAPGAGDTRTTDEPVTPVAPVTTPITTSPPVSNTSPVTAGSGGNVDEGNGGGGNNNTAPIPSDDGYDPAILYVDPHDPTDASSVDAVNGMDLASDQARANIDLGNGTAALGLMNSLIGLQNWDNASDFSHVGTVVSLYNQVNHLSGMTMPDMAGPASVIGFLSAVQSGDTGGAIYSGLQMVDTLTATAATELAPAIAGCISSTCADAIPILGLILSLTHIEENPLGVVIAALAFIPVYGQIIAVVLSICQAIFTHAPVSEGEAHATFDEFGHLNIISDSGQNGGTSTANHWMNQLAQGALSAGMQTPAAGAFAMGMPTVGYKYNPEGFNYENVSGHLTLRWTDPNGVEHSRQYDANGSRDGNDNGNDTGISDIQADFMRLMQSAVKTYPPLAYEQLEGGVLQLDYGVATVVYANNTHKFDLDTICYLFDSVSGNKYADYNTKIRSKNDYLNVNAANDEVWGIAA